MPRISQDKTQERHAFLLDLFREQPDITPREALASFKERFDATISPKILHQLRNQARNGASHSESHEPTPPETDESHEVASPPNGASAAVEASAAPRSKGKGARQRSVFVDGPKEHLVFLERILQQLHEAGATNVRIDHSTERWMVLQVDAK